MRTPDFFPSPIKNLFGLLLILLTSTCISAQIGRVGINTIIPKAMLHVADSSVLFSGAATLPVTPGAPPATGPGTRFMWYPDKAALRSGRVTGMEWNKDSIGIGSFATGLNSKATKNYSTAIGLNATADGDNSTSIGKNTMASGGSSVAIGEEVSAGGYGSIAIGFLDGAPGYGSLAMGYANTAYGDYSTALGNQNFAGGNNSFASGNETAASGFASFSAGQYTAAEADYSTTFGLGTYATSYMATIFGRYNYVSGAHSPDIWVETDPLFIIGNGNGSTYKNALTVLKNGKVGIGERDPVETFEVDGSVRFGINGTSLQEMIKKTVNHDVSAVGIGNSVVESFSVLNATTGSTVYVSPANALPDGLLIAYARVSSSGTVEVKFTNVGIASIDPAVMDFYITVIK